MLVVGRRRWHFFLNNEFSGDGKAGGAANCWWFGCNFKLGKGGNDCGHNQDGQAVFGRKINGKGAMLETMTFWANKEFIAYVVAGGVVRFQAIKEFRIQLSWHG